MKKSLGNVEYAAITSAVWLQSHQTEHDTLLKPFDFHLGNKSGQWLLVVGCCAKIRSLFTSSPQIITRRTKGFFVARQVPSDHRRRRHAVAGGTEEPRWRDRWASCTTVCRISYQASHRRLKGFSDFLTKMTAGYILASRNRKNLPLLILWGGQVARVVCFNTLQLSNQQRPKIQPVVQFYPLNLHFQRISLLSYAINDIRLADNKVYRLITLWNVDHEILFLFIMRSTCRSEEEEEERG